MFLDVGANPQTWPIKSLHMTYQSARHSHIKSWPRQLTMPFIWHHKHSLRTPHCPISTLSAPASFFCQVSNHKFMTAVPTCACAMLAPMRHSGHAHTARSIVIMQTARPEKIHILTTRTTSQSLPVKWMHGNTAAISFAVWSQSWWVKDVFDSANYRHLLHCKVCVGNQTYQNHYFSDTWDIALGLSTDGYCPFKWRKMTAWLLIIFLYDLPPEIRFHLEHILSLGVIPGPKKPKDIDSFLWPLVQELLLLAKGVAAFDVLKHVKFNLHAFLILIFGDILAMLMIMQMKDHNGFSSCRMCEITGVRSSEPGSKTYYVLWIVLDILPTLPSKCMTLLIFPYAHIHQFVLKVKRSRLPRWMWQQIIWPHNMVSKACQFCFTLTH